MMEKIKLKVTVTTIKIPDTMLNLKSVKEKQLKYIMFHIIIVKMEMNEEMDNTRVETAEVVEL